MRRLVGGASDATKIVDVDVSLDVNEAESISRQAGIAGSGTERLLHLQSTRAGQSAMPGSLKPRIRPAHLTFYLFYVGPEVHLMCC